MQTYNHNGQRRTRKEVQDEKLRKGRKGLITPEVVFYFGRTLIAIVVEWFKP